MGKSWVRVRVRVEVITGGDVGGVVDGCDYHFINWWWGGIRFWRGGVW